MKKSFKVKEEFRTNSLSHIPGGVTVVVEYEDQKSREYDNIKNPEAYIKKINNYGNVLRAYIK